MLKKFLFIIHFFGILHLAIQENKIKDEFIDSLIRTTFPYGFNEKLNYEFADVITPQSSRTKSSRKKRDIGSVVEFRMDDNIVKLKLTPVQHDAFIYNFPVWMVKSDPQAKDLHRYMLLDKKQTFLEGIFYEDIEHEALLYGYYRGHQMFYDGVIGEGNEQRMVRSIPHKWYDMKVAGSNNHVIFKTNEDDIYKTIRQQLNDTDYFKFAPKLAKPLDTLYPKLILVIEHNYFKLHNENIKDMMKYLSIFWNSVSLKFRQISYPKVNVLITGIVIAQDESSLPFIWRAVNRTYKNQINDSILIREGSVYFGNQFEKKSDYRNYDSAVVMTNLRGGTHVGLAFVAAICLRSVIYINDNANFNRIATATHEVGHTLGLTHDKKEISKVPTYSSILSPGLNKVQNFLWSDQSIRQLKAFATIVQAKCLEHPYRIKNS